MKNPASAASSAHVYLLRGVLNIFSLGLDDIAAKLRAQGIPVTVANFASWSSLADEAAAGYRSGKLKTIILVGHSSGATALPDMVAKLDQLGVPVELAIGLDSVFRTSLKGRVGRYINFYIANGAGTPVEKTRQFQGTLENVNVQDVPGVGHMSIEKNQIMQEKVISAIDAVVFGRPARSRSLGRARRDATQPAQRQYATNRRMIPRTAARRKFCQFSQNPDDGEQLGGASGGPAMPVKPTIVGFSISRTILSDWIKRNQTRSETIKEDTQAEPHSGRMGRHVSRCAMVSRNTGSIGPGA